MSKPKRHHFVTRVYLERFAHHGRVLVRWRGKPGAVVTGVQNVAVESGFYDVEGPDGERSDAVEKMLADLEGDAAVALKSIDENRVPPGLGTTERATLAAFLALQLTRTPEARDRILFPRGLAAHAGEHEIDTTVVAEYLEHVYLGFRPNDSEVRTALDYAHVALRNPAILTKEFTIQVMVGSVNQFTPILLDKHWCLEIARKPRLITSDFPLVIWRKPSPRDKFEGVGIANAEEIRFPLDPGKQLVLTPARRPPVREIEPDRVRACNADVASACHRFIVGNPNWPTPLHEAFLAPRRPVLRFNTGPGYERQLDGTFAYMGEVLHMWVPRR